MNEPILAPPGLPPGSTVRAEILAVHIAKLDELVGRTCRTRWEVLNIAIATGLAAMDEDAPTEIPS